MSLGTIRRFDTSHIFGVLTFSMCCAFERDARFFRQAKMSSRFHWVARAAAVAAMLAISSPGFAQSDDVDPELRVQQLENQLRQLTGQNEELQFRNRQLEEQIRQLQAANPAAANARPNVAAAPPPAATPRQPQQGAYDPQMAAPAPVTQEQPVAQAQGRRRGDAFDPSQNPNAPGAPRALGGGQLPMPTGSSVGAPGGRGAGEPLDLANTAGARYPQANPPGNMPPLPPRNANANAPGGLTTAPPT